MRLKTFLALLACVLSAVLLCAVPALATGDHHEYTGEPGSDVGYDAPCLAIDLDEERVANRACDDLPHFKSSFLNRIWTFHAAVDYFVDEDYHVLSMTLDRIERLPAKFRKQDDELLDQDMSALLDERTRIYDPEGYLIDHEALDDAEYVKVRGRLLRPRRWHANSDDELVPTVRAKRIYITEWASRRADEEPEPDPEPVREPKPGEGDCPHEGTPEHDGLLRGLPECY